MSNEHVTEYGTATMSMQRIATHTADADTTQRDRPHATRPRTGEVGVSHARRRQRRVKGEGRGPCAAGPNSSRVERHSTLETLAAVPSVLRHFSASAGKRR